MYSYIRVLAESRGVSDDYRAIYFITAYAVCFSFRDIVSTAQTSLETMNDAAEVRDIVYLRSTG